jgi:hypothetical protein
MKKLGINERKWSFLLPCTIRMKRGILMEINNVAEKNSHSQSVVLALGVLTIILLVASNLAHIFFTWSVIAEEIQTGWGQPTNMDIGVLVPWLIEGLFCLPSLVVAVIYFIFYSKNQGNKPLFIANLSLTALVFAQILLFNLLVHF